MSESRNILILGGGGFIGHALASRMAAHGHAVTRVDAAAMAPLTCDVCTVVADLADPVALVPLLRTCDTVVHLASATTPSSSANRPLHEGEHNLAPMLRLLELLQATAPPHVLFVSSGGTVYGAPEQLPAAESAPLQPHSYHAAGKVALEAFLGAYRHLSGSTVSVLRPSNIYGPGQPLRPGFGLIRHILESVRQNRPITVWGDGENVRDYLYIDDMVSACHQLIEHGSANDTFNLGAGSGTTINSLLRIVEQAIGQPVAVDYQPARALDVRAIVLDCAKLRAATGWQPQTDLKEGIRRTWHWLNTQ